MFNQKVNGYTAMNPGYLSVSVGAPNANPRDIHNCGITIEKYTKKNKCDWKQSWCSPHVSVEAFGMRPIVNSNEYFNNIKQFLSNVVMNESILLKLSGLPQESYTFIDDYGKEPMNSLLQTMKVDVSEKLSCIMAKSMTSVPIFKEYNPINEGFVITDITITPYRSTSNKNHFFHEVMFSANNTTRYNTVSFVAQVYQDITPMIGVWKRQVSQLRQNDPQPHSERSHVYISMLDFLNNTKCTTGQEDDCSYGAYTFQTNSQLINKNGLTSPVQLAWESPYSTTDETYNLIGNYTPTGQIKIYDSGPADIDQLVNNYYKQF